MLSSLLQGWGEGQGRVDGGRQEKRMCVGRGGGEGTKRVTAIC